MDNPSGERVKAAAFEGMFVRGLEASGDFAAKLRALGLDLERMDDDYPIELWKQAFQIARKFRFPDLSERAANHELGRCFVRGYTHTLLGRVIMVGLRLMGPGAVLARLPKLMNSSRKGRGMKMEVRESGAQERLLLVDDPYALPEFNSGVVFELLQELQANPEVSLEGRSPQGFTLRVRWSTSPTAAT